ncbi:unnamed protein product [Schistosoma margrebowiei]|uniref:Uncharacterized protein n=1 Tax=Schistosoma margrebowiei TaxID=48269 RepID=A0A183MPB4_9TREM|nr:unnamed protein product [Schistosoma margrebowiei]
MEDDLKEITKALTPTFQEVLRYNKHHHKEWISSDTLDKIEEKKKRKTAVNNSRTRIEKVKAQTRYTEVNKMVKGKVRSDKQKYVRKAAREDTMENYVINRRNWQINIVNRETSQGQRRKAIQ